MTLTRSSIAGGYVSAKSLGSSVTVQLVEARGFDPRRIVCEAFGRRRPQHPGSKAKNRRVEIVIAD